MPILFAHCLINEMINLSYRFLWTERLHFRI